MRPPKNEVLFQGRQRFLILSLHCARRHGSIAVIERLTLTVKQNLAWLPMIPLQQQAFFRELACVTTWYNLARPHMALDGRTPDEVYRRLSAGNRQPRFEPRPQWRRRSPCATPLTLVKGMPGVPLVMEVAYVTGRRHLPIVTLKRAA